MSENENKYNITDDEFKEILEIRKAWGEATERERFLLKEALKEFFYTKRK